jgi:hypothetical protein
MASATGIAVSFNRELLQGRHDIDTDNLYLALYSDSATLNSDTTHYKTTNEISGTGYTAGGKVVSNVTVFSNGSSGIVDGDDLVWTTSTFTAAAGLLYNLNSTDSSAIATFDFGGNRRVSNGTFTVQLPTAVAGTAFVEIASQ